MFTKNRFIYICIFFIALLAYLFIGNYNYHENKWKNIEFKGIVIEAIKTKKLIYYKYSTKDSVFALKDSPHTDFSNNVQIGDSIYKIKGINYCVLYKKNGKVIVTEF